MSIKIGILLMIILDVMICISPPRYSTSLNNDMESIAVTKDLNTIIATFIKQQVTIIRFINKTYITSTILSSNGYFGTLSNDDSMVLVATENRNLIIYELSSRKEIFRYSLFKQPLFDATLNTNYLVLAQRDGVKVFTSNTKLLYSYSFTLATNDEHLFIKVKISDNNILAMLKQNNIVGIYKSPSSNLNAQPLSLDQTIQQVSDLILAMDITKDGIYFALGGYSGKLYIYLNNGSKYNLVQNIINLNASILSISFSEKGNQLLVGCSSKQTYLFKIKNSQYVILDTISHTQTKSVAISSGGNTILRVSYDKILTYTTCQIQNCLTCNSSACGVCENGYTLINNQCICVEASCGNVTCQISNCQICNQSQCQKCQQKYSLIQGKCSLTQTQIPDLISTTKKQLMIYIAISVAAGIILVSLAIYLYIFIRRAQRLAQKFKSKIRCNQALDIRKERCVIPQCGYQFLLQPNIRCTIDETKICHLICLTNKMLQQCVCEREHENVFYEANPQGINKHIPWAFTFFRLQFMTR